MDTLRRLVLVALVALLAGIALPGAASAAGTRTVYVDDNGTPNAAGKGACGKPNYASIQAAVNDLTAKRVVVCKGTYAEQITVGRSLSLEGRSGAVIAAPASLSGVGAIVEFSGAQTSRIKGFTITGANTAATNLYVGVDVRDGATLTISHNRIRDIRGVGLGSTQGTGIVVDAARADITDNTLERYGTGGVLVTSPGGFAMIDGNTLSGQTGAELNNGQIGINIREGGKGDVEDNTITGNKASDGGGIGIVVDLTDSVSLHDNTVTNNGRGIVLGDETGDVEVRSNVVRDNLGDGIFLTDASFNTIVENESSGNGGEGIHVETAAGEPNAFHNVIATNRVHNNGGNGIFIGVAVAQTIVKENKVHDNGGTDIVDANGTPLVNTYSDNTCGTSNPSGLCK